jgi:phosphoribosylglycinamide formyltransferase-1
LSRDLSVPVHVFAPGAEDDRVIDQWRAAGISAVVCAGYLKLIPAQWIRAFPHRIWNVHPALLPKHGGPGMYGLHIHRAVLAAGDAESGLTVHEVSERYDEGRALFQCRVPVAPQDGPEDLQARILRAEHWALPRVVEALLLNQPLPRPDQCPA